MAFLLMAGACQSKKEPIQQLNDRLTGDSIALHKLQDNYQQRLKSDFYWCDSMLQHIPSERVDYYLQTLILAQAYLDQFDEMLPVMQHTISYSRQQLNRLKNDIDTHYINDSLAAAYLEDETAVIDTLHNRILYFQDRLSTQDKVLSDTKKSIRKDAKP